MAIIIIGAAMFLEMRNDKGLTPTMAGFLVAIVGTFSAANLANTAKHMETNGKNGNSALHDKIDSIQETISSTYNKESEAALVGMLSRIDQNMTAIKDTTAQVGSGMLNLNNSVQGLKR